ncbi:hypothetical protein BCV70DRAFT_145 [Testicularia cyperi]|uniref:ABC transporter domain-containing protein n=1 Tax=Testicularia cyperi TaxID=1882483 RepID=A0A317XWF8_9BASI|nr:hypothetical protein BCV70DRAFT_145 [Testicularia cyperi]
MSSTSSDTGTAPRAAAKDPAQHLSSWTVAFNQWRALTKKNWLVLRSYWLVNLIRCLFVPVIYYVFLGYAKNLFNTTNDLGLGEAVPVRSLSSVIGSRPIYWLDSRSDSSSGSSTASRFSPEQIIDIVTAGLATAQRSLVRRVSDNEELGRACPQAFNGLSSCFGAVEFTEIAASGSVAYTIRLDPGLNRVRVSTNTGDAELRTFPLQWAVDSAIFQLNGAEVPPAPLEQPFSYNSNEQQRESQRTGFLGGVPEITALAFFIAMLGVVYHLPSSVSEERGSGMTSLLTTMGCAQWPRVLSWLFGPAAAYVPAYFIMGGVISSTLWTKSNIALCLFAHVLPGLALASWSLFVATFFARANVSSIITTAIAILMAIVALITREIGEGGGAIIGLLFPSASFVYEFVAISAYERRSLPARVTGSHDASNPGPSIIGQIVVQLIAIVLYPVLTVLLERKLYFAEPFLRWLFRRPSNKSAAAANAERQQTVGEKPGSAVAGDVGAEPALKISQLVKQYNRKKASSLAVDRLDLEVPRGSITCLLGSNGSGKSTTIGVIGGSVRPTSGQVLIDGIDRAEAPPGLLGVCPQKDVLYPQLTCVQHVELFHAIKVRRHDPSSSGNVVEDAEGLLVSCELGHKLRNRPAQLSGGQKRRLQTSLALVGQSSFLLFDEATSGLDPLSRRAIWKILNNERGRRTILFTSHFLDEADLLGDRIVILAAPGRKLCEGTPVQLKTQFGEGTYIHISPKHAASLGMLSDRFPGTKQVESIEPDQASFLIPTTDPTVVADALEVIEERAAEYGVRSYDVAGPSLESVFLLLNSQHARDTGKDAEVDEIEGRIDADANVLRQEQRGSADNTEAIESGAASPSSIGLADGGVASVLTLALAQFRKRLLVSRRSYVPPLLAILVGIVGSIVPLAFFSGRDPTCGRGFTDREFITDATYWYNPRNSSQLLYAGGEAPQAQFGASFNLSSIRFERVDVTAFNSTIAQLWNSNMRGLGGVAFPPNDGLDQFAYLADFNMIYPIASLNLISNAELAGVRTTADAAPTIRSSYRPLSALSLGSGLGSTLKWAIVFGLVQAVWPAFAVLYPSAERNSRVKAMTLTNGMRALPFWLGHLLAEIPVVAIISVVVSLVFAFASDQFRGVGILWVVLFLYGIAATLQSFIVSLIAPNQLAAFGILAAWNVLAFLIYFSSTMLTATYYVGGDLTQKLNIVYYVEAILAPSVSATRAGFVSVNLFNLLCNGNGGYASGGIGAVERLGGPIIYVIVWGLVCGVILVGSDAGWWPAWVTQPKQLFQRRKRDGGSNRVATKAGLVGDDDNESVMLASGPGVRDEALRLDSADCSDVLQASHLVKTFGSLVAVDDVSLGVRREETVALLGINGGGKTTTHALIRGELAPDRGRVTIAGVDVSADRTLARSHVASVPQFDGLDALLTVREHLRIYAAIKGIPRSQRVQEAEAAMYVTNLRQYADRRAGALSGGNMRKLSLAIALMGNPAVLLLDELSSGVDSWTKRGLWQTLRRVGRGRATLMTTHSMEEAQALADRVAIQASRILALGTIGQLRQTRPAYELQLDVQGGGNSSSAQINEFVRSLFPDATTSDEASARFEIPITPGQSIATLFRKLERARAEREAVGITAYQISPVSLESLFLDIVRKSQSVAAKDEIGRHH